MSQRLNVRVAWEHLADGRPEERATFAALGIYFNNISLTEAEDSLANRLRQDVHLSAYRLAEWLAWNWWRLRWEPRRNHAEWALAHRTSSIGGGYVWPNITIFSDGKRIVLNAQPTQKNPSEPLRYIAQTAAIVSASEFETEIDSFVRQVIERLRAERVAETNLNIIWRDLLEERSTPKIAVRRKLEALMGRDVDEAISAEIDQLLADASSLGEDAVEELAAQNPENASPLTAEAIIAIAKKDGFDFNPRDTFRLKKKDSEVLPTGVTAWRRGVAAANAVRQQLELGAAPISNNRLSEMLGVSKRIVGSSKVSSEIPFILEEGSNSGRIALRSKYETGRRFALSRLLGDRLTYATAGQLRPATNAYTYRQKMQRAFAGELLCPFDALNEMLRDDVSDDRIDDAARYFNVSERTVRTLLVNHGKLQRDDIERELELVA